MGRRIIRLTDGIIESLGFECIESHDDCSILKRFAISPYIEISSWRDGIYRLHIDDHDMDTIASADIEYISDIEWFMGRYAPEIKLNDMTYEE